MVSEAMVKLNVPTTRALAAVTSGEQVIREQVLPGGVITRVAESFVRVGTFQYFSSRGDVDAIRQAVRNTQLRSPRSGVPAASRPTAGEYYQPRRDQCQLHSAGSGQRANRSSRAGLIWPKKAVSR